jgi:phage terminase large subunit
MRLEPVKASEWILIPKDVRPMMRTKDVVYFGLNDVFFDKFNDDSDIVFDYGGMGSGKSVKVATRLIKSCLEDEYFRCYYGRKIFDTVFGSCFKTITDTIEDLGLEHLFNFSIKPNSSKVIVCKKNGNTFMPFGGDNQGKLKSIKDPTHIWMEEADQFELNDFSLLLTRLRTEKAKTQMILTSNTEKVHDEHWLRKNLIDANYAGLSTTLSTYQDNYFINQEEYYKKLELAYGYDDMLLGAVTRGEWGVITVGNPFFYSYKSLKHYRTGISHTSGIYLDISFDFNKDPCTAVIGQFNHHDNAFKKFDVILGDPKTYLTICPHEEKSPLEIVCIQIMRKYVLSGLFTSLQIRVTGDASGERGIGGGGADIRYQHTMYTTIKRELKISSSQVYLRPGNPSHKFSGELGNKVYRELNEEQFIIAHPMIQADILQAYKDKKDSLNEAKEQLGLHILDATRYLDDFWFCYHQGKFTSNMNIIDNYIQKLKNKFKP